MYDHIGKKIKSLARGTFIVEAIGAIIGALVCLFIGIVDGEGEFILYGLLCLFCGPLVAWISSWMLYGFGQLIDNSDTLVEIMENQANINGTSVPPSTSQNAESANPKGIKSGISSIISKSNPFASAAPKKPEPLYNTHIESTEATKATPPASTTIQASDNIPKTPTIGVKPSQIRTCPYCGEIVNSKYCDICGKENNLSFKSNIPVAPQSPQSATPTVTNTSHFSQFKCCPYCGEIVNSKYCDMCGKKNNLF